MMPELLGGSADLTGSNLTKAKSQKPVTPEDFTGNYIHYGVREHGMAAAMNGIAVHRGLVPYGGTFLIFTDYCRPAIRLSALMKQRVIYVMTHDSIGLGEDGPTHQPLEQPSPLRALPNLLVFRPAYRASVLGNVPRVAIEAASTFGWSHYVGDSGSVIGMPGFGASAPAEELYAHFGITAEKLVEAALARVAQRRQ